MSNAVATTKAASIIEAECRGGVAIPDSPSTTFAAPPPAAVDSNSRNSLISMKISFVYCSEFPTVEIVRN